uniref:Uncharacterized protein n=1 Tax=Thermoanaerobaculum aquaticum TaxID=1312852 RepID=A0A7C2SF54_9BACT
MFVVFCLALLLSPEVTAAGQDRLERRGGHWYWPGAVPAGTVVAVAAWADVEGLLAYVNVKHEVLKGGSGRREIAWAPADRFPDEGFYAMVDVASGLLATGGWELGTSTGLEVQVAGRSSELRISGGPSSPSYLVVLVARPGRGVWALVSPDGSKYDRDGTENGEQWLSAFDFAPLGESQGLETFEPGDHIVVAELRSGAVIRTTVSGR